MNNGGMSEPNPKSLVSVEAVIKAFGGNAGMAARYRVLPSAVSNWKTANRFPPRLHWRIEKDAEELGFTVSPEIFSDDMPASDDSPREDATQ